MTSRPPAHPRPFPLVPPPSDRLVSHMPPPAAVDIVSPTVRTRTAYHDEEDAAHEAVDLDFVDSRPAKKRKVTNSGPPGAAGTPSGSWTSPETTTVVDRQYVRANWSTAIERRQPEPPDASPTDDSTVALLPARPWASQITKKNDSPHDVRPRARVRKNVKVPTVPDAMAPPEEAPCFERGRRADYFPWTGTHPEDNLNENTIPKGYFDRAPNPPEKELNTAKAPIYNATRHRSGLASLSALFALVINHSHAHRAYPSTSSFKGPQPRVTLTETKRRAWIADLANVEVPLKRLSKTVPQGIRGQSLLEQCLLQLVPPNRALWFIRCVGANEIRTLKRKGINPAVAHAAEAKWLREWTVHAEQWVEHALSARDHVDWNERMSYTLQLVTRLYAENLLDRDHYLDWIVKSFSAASVDHCPFWLLCIDTFQTDLLAFRKRSRQVAEALALRLTAVHDPPPPVLAALVARLTRVVRVVAHRTPAAFLIPERWADCKLALSRSLNTANRDEHRLLRFLDHVNVRTAGGGRTDGDADPSVAERVVDVLDATRPPFEVGTLFAQLSALCPRPEQLMETCLSWSVSRYRTRPTRVYLGARLLRRCHQQGADVDAVLFRFLSRPSPAVASGVDLGALQHLVSELSRSHTFSVSRYLQWLTVRGRPRPQTFPAPDLVVLTDRAGRRYCVQQSQDDMHLLTECSLLGDADHVRHLRNAVLRRGGFDEDNESTVVEACRSYLQQRLMLDDAGPEDSVRPVASFAQLPWSLKTHVSHFLRAQMAQTITAWQQRVMQPPDARHDDGADVAAARFHIVRDTLEQLGDIAILADVLRAVVFVKHDRLLASVADTITGHAEALSAIGALAPLHTLVCQAYLTLRPVKTSMPWLATSLIRLCRQFPSPLTPVRALEQDLVRGDRSRAVAACSPFSDGVAISLQQAADSFYDDFEAILQTEPHMPGPTLTRLADVLASRIAKSAETAHGGQLQLRLCRLLGRLTAGHTAQGNAYLKQYLITTSHQSTMWGTRSLLVNLLATRCLSPDTLLDVYSLLPASSPLKDLIWHVTHDTVAACAPRDGDDDRWYAVRLEMTTLARAHPAPVCEVLTSGSPSHAADLPRSLVGDLVADPDIVAKLSARAALALLREISRVLGLADASRDVVDQIQELVHAPGPLSLRYVRLKLRALCQRADVGLDEVVADDIAGVVCAALDDHASSLAQLPQSVRGILRALGPVVSTKIRARMDHRFFQALPRFLHNKSISHFPLPGPDETDHLTRALQRVCLVQADPAGSSPGASVSALVETLSVYLRCLGTASPGHGGPTVPGGSMSSPAAAHGAPAASSDTMRAFLLATIDTVDTIMRMICIKRVSFNPSPTPPSLAAAKHTQQDHIRLTGLVITIAHHPAWNLLLAGKEVTALHQQKAQEVVDFMFHVAATLTDDMSDDARLVCGRLLKDKLHDRRVQWLLGNLKMFGSRQFPEAGTGLEIHHDTHGTINDFKPKSWEMLEGGGLQNDGCLGLGLFGARRV